MKRLVAASLLVLVPFVMGAAWITLDEVKKPPNPPPPGPQNIVEEYGRFAYGGPPAEAFLYIEGILEVPNSQPPVRMVTRATVTQTGSQPYPWKATFLQVGNSNWDAYGLLWLWDGAKNYPKKSNVKEVTMP